MKLPGKVLTAARSAMQIFYDDLADVWRVDEEGNTIDFVPVHLGIACHLDLDTKPLLVQGAQTAKADGDFTVYCPPETDIQEGDRLKVTHKGQTGEYDVGKVYEGDLNRLCRCRERGVV